MLWTIPYFPKATHHIFLSHCAEDRNDLILPVYQHLRDNGIVPWIDRHDYPGGRPSRSALRDGLLSCRHIAFFITDSMISQPRGWTAWELAWSEQIQDNLLVGGGPNLVNVILPLLFVKRSNRRIPRTVWQTIRDREVAWDQSTSAVDWSVQQIEGFLNRESRRTREMAKFLDGNSNLKRQMNVQGQWERTVQFAPRRTIRT